MDLRVKDIAGLLRVSEKTIYRMIKNETIPCYRFGGQWRFDKKEIVSWMEDTRESSYRTATKNPPVDEESISISGFLRRGGIHFKIPGDTKEAAILACLEHIKAGIPQMDIRRLFAAIMERENLCPTAVGHGIALPHPKPFREFTAPLSSIALCYLERRIPFDSLDSEQVDTLFFIFPKNERRFLRIQAKLSRLLKDDEVTAAIRKVSPADTLYEVFSRKEEQIFSEAAG